MDVSIICASLPILRAPLIKLFPHLGKDSTRGVPGGNSGRRAHGPSEISMQDQLDWRKSGQTHVGTLRGTLDDDTASDEERILSPHEIRMTTEVRLDYEKPAAARSGSFAR